MTAMTDLRMYDFSTSKNEPQFAFYENFHNPLKETSSNISTSFKSYIHRQFIRKFEWSNVSFYKSFF